MWQLRQHASKWNSALDHSPFWSVGAWLFGAVANGLVFLALRKEIADKIGLDLGWVIHNRLALICLLGATPLLGGVKKALKLIEVQDDHARAEMMNRNIANIKRCGVEVAKSYKHGVVPYSVDHEKHIIDMVAAYIVIAFAEIAGKDQEALKAVVTRIESGKLTEIIAMAPSGALRLSTTNDLARPETAFSYCIKSRKILTISDIALEVMKGKNSKFKVTASNQDGGHGSMICYPVIGYTSNEVRYVLSIYSDVERSFDPADNKYYSLLLSTYAAHMLTAAQ